MLPSLIVSRWAKPSRGRRFECNASQVPAMYVYDYMFQAQNLAQGFAASSMMLLSVLIVLIPWAYLEFGGKKRV